MNEQQLEDLKQFIDGRISQAENRINGEFDERLGSTRDELMLHISTQIGSLRQEMLDGFTGVGEAI